MITDGIVTANVCVIPKRPVVIRPLDKNGLSVISVLSNPVSFVLLVVIAAVVVDVVVFIAAFIVVFQCCCRHCVLYGCCSCWSYS